MVKKTKAFVGVLVLLAALTHIPDDLNAQCYGALMLSPSYFEFDHLVRLAVHFGDESQLPEDVLCGVAETGDDSPVYFPIFAYNLHEGIEHLEFSIRSPHPITGFLPENCLAITSSSAGTDGDYYHRDLTLDACQPLCGPALVGYAEVVPEQGADVVWVDLVEHQQTHQMLATDCYGVAHHVFTPHHGGYVCPGGYLYACQPPLCDEPNAPVRELWAELSFGCSVKLTWVAGGGNKTRIICRQDRFPSGYEDGTLVVEMDSTPGESQYFFHTGMPQNELLYYKAFSLTKDAAGNVLDYSFAECSSIAAVFTDCEISVEKTTLGGIKKIFR